MLFGGVFDLESVEKELKDKEKQSEDSNIWNDSTQATKLFSDIAKLKDKVLPWKKLLEEINGVSELIDIYKSEEDADIQNEIQTNIDNIGTEYEKLRIKALLSDKNDENDCYLSIHSGAGGTEACDWTSMLLRMYLRWTERHNFKTTILDLQEDMGGVKSVTMLVEGSYAFGYLKAEAGVHRLIRISPFDSNARRHTSFASVYASPQVDDNIEIDLKPEDYRLDTYRAGGAGGQHVNKTDSAVRITHYETGIVVQCQNERSQIMNKEVAFKMLRSRLCEYYNEKAKAEREKDAIQKKDIEWGSQIRTYVFQPYTMVKDHRTLCEKGNINAVMDGDIDDFIEAYLRFSKEQ